VHQHRVSTEHGAQTNWNHSRVFASLGFPVINAVSTMTIAVPNLVSMMVFVLI
jgi:hypothetical protein